MTEEEFIKATYINQKVHDLGDVIRNLRYCLAELEEEDRNITVSVDQSSDIHSIPIKKEVLIKHIEDELLIAEQEFERYKRKFEKL